MVDATAATPLSTGCDASWTRRRWAGSRRPFRFTGSSPQTRRSGPRPSIELGRRALVAIASAAGERALAAGWAGRPPPSSAAVPSPPRRRGRDVGREPRTRRRPARPSRRRAAHGSAWARAAGPAPQGASARAGGPTDEPAAAIAPVAAMTIAAGTRASPVGLECAGDRGDRDGRSSPPSTSTGRSSAAPRPPDQGAVGGGREASSRWSSTAGASSCWSRTPPGPSFVARADPSADAPRSEPGRSRSGRSFPDGWRRSGSRWETWSRPARAARRGGDEDAERASRAAGRHRRAGRGRGRARRSTAGISWS